MYWPEIFLGPGNTELPSTYKVQHFNVAGVLKASACVYLSSLHLLHRSTHRKDIKLKFISQIGYAVLLSGMFFL